jgi:hypothetical protein
MAKRTSSKEVKTSNKELKPKKQVKEEVAKKEPKKVEVPKTEYVKIVLVKDGKEYIVGYKLACELVDLNRANLA